ncbi:hypothetical protein [Microbacterium sp. A84]|uniref:hypothetical protein n=1 Tax=Microbacterium sp. A84 TaxID=3450715 RepID=UPI003F423838
MLLEQACAVDPGFSVRSRLEPESSGLLALHQGCVTQQGEPDLSLASRVSHATGSHRHLVRTGDVLFRSRGSAASTWAVDESLQEPAIALLPLYILRPAPDILDAEYLAWLIMQPAAQAHFARETVGSNLQMIKKSAITSLPIDLPPLAIQHDVATVARLASRERVLETQLIALRRKLLTLRLHARISNAALTTGTHDD